MNKPIRWNEEESAFLVDRHIEMFPGQLPKARTLRAIQEALPENRRRVFFTTMEREPVVRKITEKQGLALPESQSKLQEQRDARNKRQRAARLAAKKKVRGSYWECPYCDYNTTAKGGKTRHLKTDHPGKTGMVHLSKGRDEQMGNHSPNLTDRIMELVADKIAAQILKGIS